MATIVICAPDSDAPTASRDHQVGQHRQQSVSDRRRQRRTAVGHGQKPGQVVTALLDLVDQGARHRVADHQDAQHPFAFGQPQDGVGVEAHDIIGDGDPTAGGDGVERAPLGGTVHEGGISSSDRIPALAFT